ncbi:hypothetical protein QYM36_013688 [Artemia franciscana]|uniref:Uncharacterized protein n=1 Tax=Artemia franciscana TaxID=6661 RepID=A0AA88HDN3_ARTSF|nr:hypothetical protein QYM36_013688 [Artemia franciscana]
MVRVKINMQGFMRIVTRLARIVTSQLPGTMSSAVMSEREERLFRSQTTRNANNIFLQDEAVQYILDPDGELSGLEIKDDEDLGHEEDDNDPD